MVFCFIHITKVAPNGVVFVKPHIRRGVLGRMLMEILDTRILVKKSMKLYKGHKVSSLLLKFRVC